MAYSTSQRGNQWCPPWQQKNIPLLVLARKLQRCLICWLGPNMVTGLDRKGGDVWALGNCWQLSWICGRERVYGRSGNSTFCLLARMPGRNGKSRCKQHGFQLYSCGMSLKTLMFFTLFFLFLVLGSTGFGGGREGQEWRMAYSTSNRDKYLFQYLERLQIFKVIVIAGNWFPSCKLCP